MMEIIQPEFEIDVKPYQGKTLVRVIDLTQGKVICRKEIEMSREEAINKVREKLLEALAFK